METRDTGIIIDGRKITTVAVDFDGTLVECKFPDIGDPIPEVIDYVKYLKSKGCELILWTNREGKLLDDALEFCNSQGLVFDSVNENMQWRTDLYNNDSRKIGADLYIDDKSIHPKEIIRLMEEVNKFCLDIKYGRDYQTIDL